MDFCCLTQSGSGFAPPPFRGEPVRVATIRPEWPLAFPTSRLPANLTVADNTSTWIS